jgi:hypothetical protein
VSLFSVKEICERCKHAVFHECGNCLAACAVRGQDNRDHCSGTCSSRVIPRGDDNWDDMRSDYVPPAPGDAGRPYMENG